MSKKVVIDDDFIREWEPKYDETECDEEHYQNLIQKVKEDVSRYGTITRDTFKDIYAWKARRAKRHVEWANFDKYEERFRRALKAPDNEKMKVLLDPHLPGIGGPVASTVLHMACPETMPIVDFRTVEVLRDDAKYLDKKSTHHYCNTIEGYRVFCGAMNNIVRDYPSWTLRQIDRALFVYHKQKHESCTKRC